MPVSPVRVIAEKEFADAVRSKRLWGLTAVMLTLFGLMIFSFGLSARMGGEQILDPLSQILLSLQTSVSTIAPLLGLALGYDAISGEREKGTLRLILSRPIYRDQVINGKAVGAVLTLAFAIGLATMVLVGCSSILLGASLDLDLVLRIVIYVLLTILLAFTYYSISLLISSFSRRSSRSLILSILVWILFSFVIPLIGFLFATSVVGPVPPPDDTEAFREWTRRVAEITEMFNMVRPDYHFSEVATKLIIARAQFATEVVSELEALPSTIGEVFVHGWVNLVVLVLYALVPYIASYAVFTSTEKE